MLKAIGIILTVFTGMMVGFIESHKLNMRVKFLEQYLQLINFLKTEIRYSTNSIIELLQQYKNDVLSEFLNNCIYSLKTGIPFSLSWKESLKKIPKVYGLKKEDFEFIKNFADELGTSDVDGQINYCELNLDFANTYLQNAREEKNKKAKLYLMLGLFAGIAVSLLLS